MNKLLRMLLDRNFRFSILAARGFYNWMPDRKFLEKKFLLSTGKKLDLDNPKTYNEKLQWLKLHDRRPEHTTMVDKYAVRGYIKDKIGEEYLIPLVGGPWKSFDEIDFDALPDQFVLKCTHDSGGLVICRDKSKLDMAAAKKKITKSLKRNYYCISREWPYKNVPPQIIAEKYLHLQNAQNPQDDEELSGAVTTDDVQKKHGLLDYKFMCFGGKVKALFLDIGVIGRGQGHADMYYRNVYDRNFSLLPVKETRDNYPSEIAKPDAYERMVQIAELLSADFPHIRVDLYLFEGEIKVGELTFFHGGGFTNQFNPPEWDDVFGEWLALPNAEGVTEG